jgi:hypothetical protein
MIDRRFITRKIKSRNHRKRVQIILDAPALASDASLSDCVTDSTLKIWYRISE